AGRAEEDNDATSNSQGHVHGQGISGKHDRAMLDNRGKFAEFVIAARIEERGVQFLSDRPVDFPFQWTSEKKNLQIISGFIHNLWDELSEARFIPLLKTPSSSASGV